MEPNTAPPVTEAEMTSFFQRVTTGFVSLSKQAAELEEVKAKLNEVSAKLNELTDTNNTLRRERDDAIMKELEAQTEADRVRKEHSELSRRHGDVLDTIVRRDSRITELEGSLTTARAEVADWQRKHDAREREIEHVKADVSLLRERRDHWRTRAETAERELAEANKKLADLRQQVTAILGIVEQAKEPEKVVEEVKQAVPASNPSPAPPVETASPPPPNPAPVAEAEQPKPWWMADRAAE